MKTTMAKNKLITAGLVALLAWGTVAGYQANKTMARANETIKRQSDMIAELSKEMFDMKQQENSYIMKIETLKEQIAYEEEQRFLEPVLANIYTAVNTVGQNEYQVREFLDNGNYNLPTDAFMYLAEQYNVDASFALATWALETGWGTTDVYVNANNPAGIICTFGDCYYGYQAYDTQEEGLEDMFRTIAYYNNQLGLETVDEVRGLWSEANDSQTVAQIMNEIVTE